MALRFYEFCTIPEVELFLRGGIRGGLLRISSGRVHGLHGLTLIINAVTVTFDETLGTAGLYGGLTAQEVRDQIVAAIATVVPFYAGGCLNLVEAAPAVGVVVDAAGTANAHLGFSSSTNNTGVVINPPGGVAPALVLILKKATNDGYAALINEA